MSGAIKGDIIGNRFESDKQDEYVDNAPLDAALMLFLGEKDDKKRHESFITFLNILAKRISEGAMVPMPFVDVNNTLMEGLDIEHAKVGDTVQLQEEVRLRMDTMMDGAGNLWLPMFLNNRELSKGQTANVIMPVAILDVLKYGLKGSDLKGVVVNPFGRPFIMPKDLLETFIEDYEAWAEKNGIEIPDVQEG